MVINKPFKDHVKNTTEKHYCENLEKWTAGAFIARERRIIMIKWIGEKCFC